jgi:hypothetical protein
MPKAPSLASQSESSYSMEQSSVKQPRSSASQIKMCEVSILDQIVELINLWFTFHQVCHVRPQAQKAGKNYPTCGFTCAAILTSSPTSNGNAPTVDALVKPLQRLSLSGHIPGTHHSLQQSSRAEKHISHGQHSSHGHSQSSRGVTRRQTAPTDRQIHQPLKCVVCFLFPSSSLSWQILHSVTGLPEALSGW